MNRKELSQKEVGSNKWRTSDIGLLPADWSDASVGEISVTASGTTPPRAQLTRYYSKGVHAWVKTLDLSNAEIFNTDETVTDEALNETSLRIFPVGTVLVAMYGGLRQIGRTGLLRIPAAVNQAITAIQPNSGCLSSEFLLAYLNFRVEYWKSVASSSRKDPNITGADVRAFKLPLPSIGEQTAIAEALSATDALVGSLEQLLIKKRQIKQGIMQELLTGKRRLPGFSQPWIEGSFGSFATLSRERVNPRTLDLPPRCIELEHIQAASGQLENEAFESNQDAAKTVFRKGDVLFGKLRAYLRKYWHAGFDGVCSTEIWVMCAKGALQSNKYLFYTVQREEFIEAASTSYGTHMPRSDWKIVANLILRLPADEAEQDAIATVLADIDANIYALESHLAKARDLKLAMAQALLTGHIRLVEPLA
ncbi:restriction endonuclease subunit S [Duganella sp. BJB475]|uniref:restriction endonuclease subunit S n=1 Tax=Duganella sp. BJB475 TaxID=2233914 RepID=UPI000E341920|nr:restriction endonuclease subunit S [Duganella sp. BJB475]RFP15081.1 restriction endonuclease subunit S [Duganella sp. BJB475]